MTNLTSITPHIHRLVVPFEDIYTTVFVLTTGEGAVLFDTATYPEDIDNYIVPALQELGIAAEELKYVVISHNHRDHAGGLERFAHMFPGTAVAAGSTACGERIPGREVQVLRDGDCLLGCLEAVTVPGHTEDCVALLDTRTNTLLSGDGLQLYGIYGSGAWGANIRFIKEHLAAGKRLHGRNIGTVVASHDYHPCGYRADGEEVGRYIDECANALRAVGEYILSRQEMNDSDLAAQYNAASGLPTVGAHVFAAVRAAMAAGEI